MPVHPRGQCCLAVDVRRAMLPLATSRTEVPVDFVRRLVILRNAVKLDDLAQFVNENTKQFLRFLLSSDRVQRSESVTRTVPQ